MSRIPAPPAPFSVAETGSLSTDSARLDQAFARLALPEGPPPDIVPYMLDEVDAEGDVPIAARHPRYLIDQVAALCHLEGRPPTLARAALKIAWQNLFAA